PYQPNRLIWGVGATTQAGLEKAGIRTFADLLRWDQADLTARFGAMGHRLWYLARGQDRRRGSACTPVKSISKETTFGEDTGNADILDGHIWRLAEQVSDRAKAKQKAGRVVTLKLKRANFSMITRRTALRESTQMADMVYRTAKLLFDQVPHDAAYRLIGVGLSDLVPAGDSDLTYDLLDPDAAKRGQAERAADAIRQKFGRDAIKKGRALR
ncbi:MAG: DNA polymerase IV, partial [Pseudomonadota bacterium]